MAFTMNPVNLYHDPSLDGFVSTPSRSRSNGTSNGRGVDQKGMVDFEEHGPRNNMEGLQNDLLSTGPPISYRGLAPSADPRMQRSFSQRARGRPFADEAFSDESYDDMTAIRNQRTNGHSISARNSAQGPQRDHPVAANPQSVPVPPSRRTRNSNRISSAPAQGRSVPPTNSQPITAPIEPILVTRSGTRKDASNHEEDLRGQVASDRSPLQTLEVKLTDISKEEKRARVQEAELRIRGTHDATEGQNANDRAQRVVSQPARQSLRNTREADPSSRPITQSQAPLTPTSRGSSNQSRQRHSQRDGSAVDVPARQQSLGSQRSAVPTSRLYPQEPGPLTLQPQPSADPARIGSDQAAESAALRADTAQSYVPRAVSIQQRRPRGSSRTNDRPPTDRERNASHQAALQQLMGEPEAFVDRPQPVPATRQVLPPVATKSIQARRSTKEQDGPIAVDIGTLGGDHQHFDQPAANPSRSNRMQQPSQARRSQPMVGSSMPNPPTSRSNALHSVDTADLVKNRQRKSSVSFKEPFDRRRPVDEWKVAETARLTVDDFLREPVKELDSYKPWWESDPTKKGSKARVLKSSSIRPDPIDDQTAQFAPHLQVKCGPLLRYTGLKRAKVEPNSNMVAKEYWRGSVMIVTQDSQCTYESIPTLRLFSQPRSLLPPPPPLLMGEELAPEYVDPIAGLTKISRNGRALYVRPVDHLEEAKDLSRIEDDTGLYETAPSPLDVNGSKYATAAAANKRTLDTTGEHLGRYREVKGVRIYADPDRDVTFWRFNIEIELGDSPRHVAYRVNRSASVGFWVPARGASMNIMFHSCNGFSISVETDKLSGPDPLWRDVLNNHQSRPFHVMIGGGDQIYNDRVMIETKHFGDWTQIRNPHHKHQAPFTPEMKNELEDYYLERYCMWFSQGLFAMANASIPMVNIWDDHDIIDGYGSYPDSFMKSPVFCGLGDIAHKYYLLFQHQSVDAMMENDEPSWILGTKPGPYIPRVSRSVYLELGQHIAFLGIDARTERTRHDVLSIDTLELMLERCRREMVEGQTKHLIVLVGVPIAYPRLVWLENVLTSKAVEPIKALHRAGIVKTKLLNKFDGGVEVLDDLDDHWTATHHKDERNILIQDLQDLAAEKSARITMLSGDVHLAAVGQFYSNPKLKIPKDKDHRYMPNIISSAIVNTPPPDMLADVLNKRNKVHHLDKYTDENMIPMFTHDVDDKKRNNTRLLPRRNWCSIREYIPGETPPPTPPLSPSTIEDDDDEMYHSELDRQHENDWQQPPKRRLSLMKNSFNPRNFVRQLSSRGAPPNSYRGKTDSDQFQRRAASLDNMNRSHVPYGNPPQLRASSADHVPDVPALRPSFHRRPTNLSEKAARKGVVSAVDSEGNEIHFNDHVNLEGGLDIVLNCEVNQQDPAGITSQYRLLVPALQYDGSSDREKLGQAPPLNRRNTFLKKFGLTAQRGNRGVDNQGAGDMGQNMSETESYTESEGSEAENKKPKKRFSFLGSLRKKQPQQEHQIGTVDIQHPHLTPGQVERNEREVPILADLDRPRSQDLPPKYKVNFQDNQAIPQPKPQPMPNTFYQIQQPTQQPRSVAGPQVASNRQSQILPPQPTQDVLDRYESRASSTRSTQRPPRPLSYTISGASNAPTPLRSEYSSTAAEGRPPYDPDAAYISNQQHQHSLNSHPQPSMSNQIQQPTPHPLRGNGILGKPIPPSSFRSNTDSSIGMPDPPRGYGGIEAYKDPKPKRRWSLKERIGSLRESMGARRRRNDDDDDDWYSDEDREVFWEHDQRR